MLTLACYCVPNVAQVFLNTNINVLLCGGVVLILLARNQSLT